LNPAKVKKMEEEICKWGKKDPATLLNSMAYPGKSECVYSFLYTCVEVQRNLEEFLLYVHTLNHIRGSLSQYADTSETFVGYGVQNLVIFQFGI
jgi:hypothetical protein